MKKNIKKYMASSLLLAGTMFFAVGCDSNNSNNTEEVVENSNLSNNVNFEEDLNAEYGKVTNINNNQITLSLGTLNMNKERPKNDSDDSKKFDESKKPEMPSTSNGNPPELPSDGERPEPPQDNDGNSNKGNRPEMITLTGDEKVITVTDDIRIIKKNMTKPNSKNESTNSNDNKETTINLSDISVDDILKVNYNEDKTTIESIELISMGNKDMPKDDSLNKPE